MPYVKANFKLMVPIVDLTGPLLQTARGILGGGLPTGYLCASGASQLAMYRGDAFVIFNPAASTL